MRPSIAAALLLLTSSFAHGATLEIEQAQALQSPYCIDMRIAPEHKRAKPAVTSKALAKIFNCRRVYKWPLSVRPDTAMIARYSDKMKGFSAHPVLMWCTQGVRSDTVQSQLTSHPHPFHSLKGGVDYVEAVLKLQ